MNYNINSGQCPFMNSLYMWPMEMKPASEVFDDDEYSEDLERQGINLDIEKILNKIRKNNPEVFRTLRFYGIPYETAQNIVRKIIRLTLLYK